MDVSFASFNSAPAAAIVVSPAPVPAPSEDRRPNRTDGAATRNPILDAPIMVLDDEPYNVMVVRKYLRDVGYSNLLECINSSAAMNIIEQKKPSLLLLDIMMPKVSGLDILRALRLQKQSRQFPVLVLTASTDAATKREALDLARLTFFPSRSIRMTSFPACGTR